MRIILFVPANSDIRMRELGNSYVFESVLVGQIDALGNKHVTLRRVGNPHAREYSC